MRVTHLGHSCLLVETAGARILIDPGTFSAGFESVTDLDAVLVTHQHPDHLDVQRLGPLLRANPGARVWAEPSAAALCRDEGVEAADLVATCRIDVGGASVEGVGDLHAVIHADIDRIHNTGVVVRAPGEPSLFHPGDALDAEPGDVDVCCVPVSAPWCAMKETVEFVRRVAAPRIVPIHDALLSRSGRELYLRQVGTLGARVVDGLHWVDLAGVGATEL